MGMSVRCVHVCPDRVALIVLTIAFFFSANWAIPFNNGTPLWIVFQAVIDTLGYLRILL